MSNLVTPLRFVYIGTANFKHCAKCFVTLYALNQTSVGSDSSSELEDMHARQTLSAILQAESLCILQGYALLPHTLLHSVTVYGVMPLYACTEIMHTSDHAGVLYQRHK